jgi:hypothetical protein
MSVDELSREQLTLLKQDHYTRLKAEQGEGVSYGEYADIDSIISDEEIKREYVGFDFTDEDFALSGDDGGEKPF